MTKTINFSEYLAFGLAVSVILMSIGRRTLSTVVGEITRTRAVSCGTAESLNEHDGPNERNSHVPSCGARKNGGSPE